MLGLPCANVWFSFSVNYILCFFKTVFDASTFCLLVFCVFVFPCSSPSLRDSPAHTYGHLMAVWLPLTRAFPPFFFQCCLFCATMGSTVCHMNNDVWVSYAHMKCVKWALENGRGARVAPLASHFPAYGPVASWYC